MNILWTDKKRTLFGLPLSFTTYELEEERLFIRTGFFTRKEDEVRLYRIMDISWQQTLDSVFSESEPFTAAVLMLL